MFCCALNDKAETFDCARLEDCTVLDTCGGHDDDPDRRLEVLCFIHKVVLKRQREQSSMFGMLGLGQSQLFYVDVRQAPSSSSSSVAGKPSIPSSSSSSKAAKPVKRASGWHEVWRTGPPSSCTRGPRGGEDVWLWGEEKGARQREGMLSFGVLSSTELCLRVVGTFAQQQWGFEEQRHDTMGEARFLPVVGMHGLLSLPLSLNGEICGMVLLTVALRCETHDIVSGDIATAAWTNEVKAPTGDDVVIPELRRDVPQPKRNFGFTNTTGFPQPPPVQPPPVEPPPVPLPPVELVPVDVTPVPSPVEPVPVPKSVPPMSPPPATSATPAEQVPKRRGPPLKAPPRAPGAMMQVAPSMGTPSSGNTAITAVAVPKSISHQL